MNLILKIFYGKDNVKCQNIYISDNSQLHDCQSLVSCIREKISHLNFIADTDLRIEYEDDEGTFVKLEDADRDAFLDALRCAKVVEGTDSRRLKLRVSESSTPQRKMQKLSYSPDAMFYRSVSCKGLSSDYSVSASSRSTASSSTASSSTASSSTASSSATSRPVRKHLNFDVRTPSSAATSGKPPNITNHRSPLERYLLDAELQVSTQAELVQKAEDKVDQFKSAIPVVENRSPACSLCHRRENHNRVNCPYKPYKCESAFTCGDLEKHKDEKDHLKSLQQELNTEKQKLRKLELQFKCKKESQMKTVNSFNAKMRKRLVESSQAKYLSKDGRENLRIINMDLSLLDQHFKGKVPDDETNLQEALEYIRLHRLPGSKHSDQVKELWKMKGLKWPGSAAESEFLMPADADEESEQLQMALRESLRKQRITDKAETQSAVSNPESNPVNTTENTIDSPHASNNDKEAAMILMELMNGSSE
jgi:hypothetical protein